MRIILSQKEGILETLYRAQREPIGLRVTFDGVSLKTLRQWFYVTMRKEGGFDNLVLVNMGGDLWIVRRDSPELNDGERGSLPQAYDQPDRGPI